MNGSSFRPRAATRYASDTIASVVIGLSLALPALGRTAEPAAAPPVLSFADVVQEAIPSVVNISTTQTVKRPEMPNGRPGDPMEEFMRRFFDQMPKSYKERSLGSGVIINENGEILTNDHVVGMADDIDVTLPDHKRYKAKVIGKDKKTDLALIRIQSDRPFHAAKLAHDQVRVGDWVIAIGNPFGLGETVTAGIVSAKGRAIGAGPYDDFIQTDASINPGNSGGPLLNAHGEVVGINSAIYSQSGGNIGIGFAIPIEMAAHIADSLRSGGRVVRGWLGVAIQDVTPELSKALGLPEAHGALVSDVVKDGPADKAGIKRGDVIVSYQGKPVASSRELPIRVADTSVGTKAEVGLIREGAQKTVTAEVGELKDKESPNEKVDGASSLGLQIEVLTAEVADRLGLPEKTKGVLVAGVEPGSPAEAAEVRPGDVIREVNRQIVSNPKEFEKAMSERPAKKPVLLLVQRAESTVFLTISPDEAPGADGAPDKENAR